MQLRRIILYGLLYWLLGAVLTFVQVLSVTSVAVAQTIFYGFAIGAPFLFCWLFFRGALGTLKWQSGLRLAVSWMVLFSVLDGLVFIWWLDFSFARYFSWQLGFAYALLAIIAMVIAHALGETRRKQGPEGLV